MAAQGAGVPLAPDVRPPRRRRPRRRVPLAAPLAAAAAAFAGALLACAAPVSIGGGCRGSLRGG
ncbi:MAG TPA: hypothetical protein VF315_02020, partial [Steroidobacteraceae bacterium]